MQAIFAYLLLVNAAAFILMRLDKEKARRGRWRIPEATLLGIAAIGGSAGALAGMYAFRHKTRHKKFSVGLPLLLSLHLWLLVQLIPLLPKGV